MLSSGHTPYYRHFPSSTQVHSDIISIMKLVDLNIWSGVVFKPLISFIKENKKDTDIFCFQEMTNGDKLTIPVKEAKKDMLGVLIKLLPEYNYFFSPFQGNEVGLATFIKKNLKIEKFEEIWVHRWYNARENNDNRTLGRVIQLLEFSNDDKRYSVINFHGIWNGQGKTDTEDRIKQSLNVKNVLNNAKGEKILCGDFNLLPDTESLKILEKGMRNLIRDYKIQDTRGKLYPKKLRYADYILTSNKLKVLDFKVHNEEISDHLPLELTFE